MTSQSNCAVQVKIELGHRATVKKNPSPEGFTHDWTVYVRGPEGCDISHFIEKVVFNLHVSFENPKREHYKPPYAVSESGYAGFELPIDIYFKNKEEPKKLRFTYDLFLKLEDSPPVNHIRCEKLTFQNPTEEFKKKLLKAGGVPVTPHGEPTTFGQFTELFGPPITADVKKKPKQHIPSKEKSSRDHSGSSSSSSTKSFSNKHGSSTSSSHKSQRPSSKDVISKDISAKDAFSKDISAKDAFSKEHKSKEHKSHSDEKKEKKASKEPSKRSLDVVPQDTSLPKKPKQRSSSVSSNSDIKVKEKHDISEKQSDRHKHLKEKDLLKAKSNSPSIGSVRSDHEKRDKHKSKSKSESKTDKSKLEKKVDSGREFKSDNIVNSEERKKKEEKKFDSSASVQKVDMKEKYKSHVESKSKDFPSRSHQKSFDIEHIGKRSSTSTPENKQNLKRQKIEDSDVSSSEESSDSSDEEHEEIVKNIIQNLDSDEDNQDEEGSHQSEDNNEDLDVSPDRSSVSNYDYKPVLMHQSKSALDRLMNEFSDDEDDDDDMDHNLPPLSSPLIQKPSPSSSMRSFKGSPASHKSSTSSSSKPSKTSQYSPSSQKSSSSTREHHSSHKTSKSSSKSEKDKIKHSKVVSSKDAVLKEVEFSQKETSDSKKNYGKFREQSITAVEDWTKDKTNEPCTKSEEYKKDTKKYRKSSKERDSNDKVEEKHLKENKTKSKTKPEKIKKEMKDKRDMNPSVKSEEKDNREETKVEIGHGKMKENIKKEKKGYEAEVKTPEFPSSYLKDEPDLTKEFLTINGIDKAEEKEEFEYGDLGKAPNGEDLCTLISLYQKLESTQDGILLQKIIQEIQKTGLYKINESCETFDFDLCELDSSTVEVLKNYLCAV